MDYKNVVKLEQLFNTSTLDIIKQHLINNDETIAVAESVSSGLLQAAFGSTKDATQFYQGGITAYNVGQKYRHLFIEPIHALSCNCISLKVAKSMAVNVCKLFQSDWGLSITGYASPAPEGNNRLFAYSAIAYKRKIVYSKEVKPMNKEPLAIQFEYVNDLLKELCAQMQQLAL